MDTLSRQKPGLYANSAGPRVHVTEIQTTAFEGGGCSKAHPWTLAQN